MLLCTCSGHPFRTAYLGRLDEVMKLHFQADVPSALTMQK